jgi:hypothetical protein
VREGRIEKHFTGSQAKGKGLGSSQGTEVPLRRSLLPGFKHGGKATSNSFTRTGKSTDKVND